MHEIHTTKGFIIGSKPYGEAGKVLLIFTEEFGLVKAVATGVRLEKSKLRYKTQDYSFGYYSLVKGRELWRLTGVDELKVENSGNQDYFTNIAVPVASLLKRLLHGEEPNTNIFQCLLNTKVFADGLNVLNEEAIKTTESILVLRILYYLGYVGDSNAFSGYEKSTEFDLKLTEQLQSKREEMNRVINKALHESQL